MSTLTMPSLPPTGTDVTITTADGYVADGQLRGLTRDPDLKAIVRGAAGLERHVPLRGARVLVVA